jgi:hypothetical protein
MKVQNKTIYISENFQFILIHILKKNNQKKFGIFWKIFLILIFSVVYVNLGDYAFGNNSKDFEYVNFTFYQGLICNKIYLTETEEEIIEIKLIFNTTSFNLTNLFNISNNLFF